MRQLSAMRLAAKAVWFSVSMSDKCRINIEMPTCLYTTMCGVVSNVVWWRVGYTVLNLSVEYVVSNKPTRGNNNVAHTV